MVSQLAAFFQTYGPRFLKMLVVIGSAISPSLLLSLTKNSWTVSKIDLALHASI
jgi:hypothetical protein